MKTLNNQTLLYDSGCPLCSVYTTGFIKAGMLDAHGRKPFESLTDSEKQFVDVRRACNEIALIDNKNNTVTYGIDSLLKVVGHSFPIIEKVGKIMPIHWLLKKLYSFISYNRKAIIPNTKSTTGIACLPDFNYRYRIAYLIFTGLATALVLFGYSHLISLYAPAKPFYAELLIAFLQIPFQWMFVYKLSKQEAINYFGNVMTVSLFGSLLLLPAIIGNLFIHIPQQIALYWFGITALIIFAEHYRRVKLLGLPKRLCVTWLGYRVLLLIMYYFI
ncbi:MAG: hypothetical protein V4581_02430 [Bacteroidota bacterium]